MILTSRTKQLMHQAMDGNVQLVPIMHQLSHYTSINGILTWLIRNRITGYNLVDWLKINHNNSLMGMVKFIIKHHNKDLEERAIILGRDWVK